jgi:hypothetical protein
MLNKIRIKFSTKIRQTESIDDGHRVLLDLDGNHLGTGLDQRRAYPATHGTHNVGMRYLPTFAILTFSQHFIEDKIERATPPSTNNPYHLRASHSLSSISSIDDADDVSNGYPCTTEDNITSSLAFNMTRNGSTAEIHRFQPGSTLSYFIDERDLPLHDVARLKVAMHTAAHSWNLGNTGIIFQEVLYAATAAAFHVVHDPHMGSEIYAKAFFPNDYDKTLTVGPRSFRRDKVDFLSNVLCHELGHVLGIRHTSWETTEPGRTAFYFPTRALDGASVMNCNLAHNLALLVISDRDAREVRQLYSLSRGLHDRGALYGNFRVIGV